MWLEEIHFTKPSRENLQKHETLYKSWCFTSVLPSLKVYVSADHVLIKMIFHDYLLICLFQEKLSVFECPAKAHSLRRHCQITQKKFLFFWSMSCLTNNYQANMDNLEPRNTNLSILLCMFKGYSCSKPLPFLNKLENTRLSSFLNIVTKASVWSIMIHKLLLSWWRPSPSKTPFSVKCVMQSNHHHHSQKVINSWELHSLSCQLSSDKHSKVDCDSLQMAPTRDPEPEPGHSTSFFKLHTLNNLKMLFCSFKHLKKS